MDNDPDILGRARELRQNATEAKKRLWSCLRARQVLGYKFRRQCPLGPYIVDFLCWQARLVVELDGGQHMEQQASDEIRTAYLENRGFTVLRFWNPDVFDNLEGVLETIRIAVAQGAAR